MQDYRMQDTGYRIQATGNLKMPADRIVDGAAPNPPDIVSSGIGLHCQDW